MNSPQPASPQGAITLPARFAHLMPFSQWSLATETEREIQQALVALAGVEAKEAAGDATNDDSTKLEGEGDQAKAAVKDKVEDAKDYLDE